MEIDKTDNEDVAFDELLAKFWANRKKNYKKLAKELIRSGEVVNKTAFAICRYTYSKEEASTRASFDGGVRFPLGKSRPIYEIDKYELKRIYFDMAWLDASIQTYLINQIN